MSHIYTRYCLSSFCNFFYSIPTNIPVYKQQVYKGRKEDTNDIVAIKRIPFADSTPEGGVPCNVIREISLLRELDHPNVVRLFVVTVFFLIAVECGVCVCDDWLGHSVTHAFGTYICTCILL